MHELLLQAFPFPSPLGEVKLHPLSQAGVFNYSSHGKWALSTLLWSLPPTTTFISFPAPDCWACAATPAFSSRLIYLQFWEGFPSPLLRCSGLPTLFAMCLFFFVIAYYSVFLFSLGGGRSVQGAMLIWPRVVCGGTTYRLAHLVVCVFPSHLDAGIWQRHESPAVFCL
jgi:hypothetical protein